MSNHLPGTALLILLSLAGCQSTSRYRQARDERPDAQRLAATERTDDSSAVAERPPAGTANQSASAPRSADDWLREGNQHEQQARRADAKGDRAAAKTALMQARTAYQSALAQKPDHGDAHHRLGVIADQLQEYQTADYHYQIAVRQKPHDANLLSDLGYSHLLRGQYDQSEMYLQAALKEDPQHKGALNNLGLLYGRQGNYEQSLAMFRRAGTEADAQRNIKQLFPNGPAQEFASTAAASNPSAQDNEHTPRGAAPPMPDFDEMSPQQLKQLMEQKRMESVAAREQRQHAETVTPPVREQPVAQIQPAAQSPTMPDWPHRPNATTQPAPAVTPVVQPGTAAAAWAELDSSTSLKDEFARIDGAGTVHQPSSATAPPPTPQMQVSAANPLDSMPYFNGVSSGIQTASASDPVTSANVQHAHHEVMPSQGATPPYDTTPPVIHAAGQPMNLVSGPIDQAGQLAARLGMNAGPGQMFPVLPSTNSVSAPVVYPADQLRTNGAEFPPPAQYPTQPLAAPPPSNLQTTWGQGHDPYATPAAPHLMNSPAYPVQTASAPAYPSGAAQAGYVPQNHPSAYGTPNDPLERYQSELNQRNAMPPTIEPATATYPAAPNTASLPPANQWAR